MNTAASDIKGPPHIHHMDSATAYDSAKLGMWLFLATEILLFGGMFASFAIFRWLYPSEFHIASQQLKIPFGAVNTAVLIFSSYTVAMAVDAAQAGRNDKVRKLLLVTIVCGFIFLMIKSIEYYKKFSHGLFPVSHSGTQLYYPVVVLGLFLIVLAVIVAQAFKHFHYGRASKFKLLTALAVLVLLLYPVLVGPLSSVVGLIAPAPESTHFNWNGAEFANQYRMYFGLYYCMTGLHALHVILGMGILYWVYLLAQHNRFSSEYYTPMEVGGLYWHLVDLIWIYLFPLLYLID